MKQLFMFNLCIYMSFMVQVKLMNVVKLNRNTCNDKDR